MEKTNVMATNAKNQELIMMAGQGVAEVDEFTYLEATVCKEKGGMKDLKNRLSKTRSAFVRLKRIWPQKNGNGFMITVTNIETLSDH